MKRKLILHFGELQNVFCEQKLDFFCCTLCTTILQNADPLRNDGFDLFFWSFSLLGCSVLSVIFCEVVAIYGVIVAIILQTKLESVPASNIYAPESLRVGYAIFASGIIMGFANLVCGYVSGFPCIYFFRNEYDFAPNAFRSNHFLFSFLFGIKVVGSDDLSICRFMQKEMDHNNQ